MSTNMPSQGGGAPEDGAGEGVVLAGRGLACRQSFEATPQEGWEEVFPTHRVGGRQASQAGGPAQAEELGGGTQW